MQRDIDNTATSDLFMDSPSELLKQRHIRSLDDSDIYSQRNKKLPIRDSPRPFRRSSYDRSPSPPGHRDESGDVSSSWQQQRTSKSLDFSSASKLPPLGQGDLSSAPRRNVLTPLGLEPLEGLGVYSRKYKYLKNYHRNFYMASAHTFLRQTLLFSVGFSKLSVLDKQ